MRLKEVFIEVGELEYGVTPLSYSPGHPPNRRGHPDTWDAGDGPELNLPRFVTVYANGEPIGVVPWYLMVLDRASENGRTFPEHKPDDLGVIRLQNADDGIVAECYHDYEDWDDAPDCEEYEYDDRPEPEYDYENE